MDKEEKKILEDLVKPIMTEGTFPAELFNRSQRKINAENEIKSLLVKDEYSLEFVTQLIFDSILSAAFVYKGMGNDIELNLERSEYSIEELRAINIKDQYNKFMEAGRAKGGAKTKEISNIVKAKPYWDEWQSNPKLYRTQKEFKSAMVEMKFAKDESSIWRWIQKWKNGQG